MTAHLSTGEGLRSHHLARYQVAIAFGCYHGPIFRELAHLQWQDLQGAFYTFRFESRDSVVIDQNLKPMVARNYQWANADRADQRLLQHPLVRDKMVSARLFNQTLRHIFNDFGIDSPDVNFQTLRKTFARKVYEDMGRSEMALEILAHELGYSGHQVKAFVRLDDEGI